MKSPDSFEEVLKEVEKDSTGPRLLDLKAYQLFGLTDSKVEQLCIALQKNTTLRFLKINGGSPPFHEYFGNKGAVALGEMLLHNQTLQTLDLSGNSIGAFGAKVLAQALSKNTSLKHLILDYEYKWLKKKETQNFIDSEGGEALAQALSQNNTLISLSLRLHKVGNKGAEAFAKMLQHNTTLRILDLSSNEIEAVGAKHLAQALHENTCLQSLNVSSSLSTRKISYDGVEAFAQMLMKNTTLKILFLNYNNIVNKGADILSKALLQNTSLEELYLNYSLINDYGAKVFAEVLAQNTPLKRLSLSANSGISDTGAIAIAQALPKNTHLQILDLRGLINVHDKGIAAIVQTLSQNKTLLIISITDNSYPHVGIFTTTPQYTDDKYLAELQKLLIRNRWGVKLTIKKMLMELFSSLQKLADLEPEEVFKLGKQNYIEQYYQCYEKIYMQLNQTIEKAVLDSVIDYENNLEALLKQCDNKLKVFSISSNLIWKPAQNKIPFTKPTANKPATLQPNNKQFLLEDLINEGIRTVFSGKIQLSQSSYYHAPLLRKQAEQILNQKPVGTFLFSSSSQKDSVKLIYVKPDKLVYVQLIRIGNLSFKCNEKTYETIGYFLSKFISLFKYPLAIQEIAPTTKNSTAVDKKPLGTLEISFSIPQKDLSMEKELGRGGFGIVFKGKWKYTDVAIKQLQATQLSDKALEEFQSEMKIMAFLNHPNIVRLFGITDTVPYCMVMEYLPGGDLYNVLHSKKSLSTEQIAKIALDVAQGIAYLHLKMIMHRDLKSKNILVDKDLTAKVGDFGLAKIRNESTSSTGGIVGTLAWTAPEILDGQIYTLKADIFSYGMILWELMSRENPYAGANGNQMLIANWVSKGKRNTIPKDTPEKFAKLIEQAWAQEPEKRPNAEEAIQQLQRDDGISLTANSTAYRTNFDSSSMDSSYRDNLESDRVDFSP